MKKHLIVLLVILLALIATTLLMIPGGLAETMNAVPFDQPGIDLTPLVQAVLTFLAALMTYKLIPWIQVRTTAQQQEKLRAAVKVAVFAAEQLFKAGNGKEKLMYVKGQLAHRGYRVDIDEIEAAVKELSIYSDSAYIIEKPLL